MSVSGIVHHTAAPGSSVSTGDILLNVTVDDPSLTEQVFFFRTRPSIIVFDILQMIFQEFTGPFDDGDCRPMDDQFEDPQQVSVFPPFVLL